MKKSILIMAILAVCVAVTAPAFAVTTITTAATTVIGGANVIPSTGVQLSTVATDTAYCVTSMHGSSDPAKGGVQWGATAADASIKKSQSSSASSAPFLPTACSAATSLPTATPTFQ
jgi:hypothetical protein